MNSVNEELNFPLTLKKLRERDAINQLELASKVGIDRSLIANFEKGRRLPSISTLLEIANFFDVSLDYLVFGKTKKLSNKIADILLYQELMAENIALMQNNMELEEELSKAKNEIEILNNYISAEKNYIKILKLRNGK